jgi:hypothetical protein
VRVVLGMDKADLAIFGDIHRHHRRGRCRFVVDHEVRPLQLAASFILERPRDPASAARLPHLIASASGLFRPVPWSGYCPHFTRVVLVESANVLILNRRETGHERIRGFRDLCDTLLDHWSGNSVRDEAICR